MTGDIVYIDYELNSWQHLNDDIPEKSYSKYFFGMVLPTPDIIHKVYSIKGGGSAFGGKWQPKKEEDKKFLGKPNSKRTVNTENKKGGYKQEYKYDSKGKASQVRHYSNHGNPSKHSNPHDHEITWENGYPQLGTPINYFEGLVPEFKTYYGAKAMKDENITYYPYNPEENKFETLGEFKMYFTACTELGFEYNGTSYFIDEDSKDIFSLFNVDEQKEISSNLTMEQLLDLEINGVKIRDFITSDKVEITDRPGAI